MAAFPEHIPVKATDLSQKPKTLLSLYSKMITNHFFFVDLDVLVLPYCLIRGLVRS